MKKVNTDQLFNIFHIEDKEVYEHHQEVGVVDSSFILFGTVVKGVENYYIIDQLYESRYGEQYTCFRNSLKVKYFIGLMRYLERIEELPGDTLSTLEDEFGLQAINYALQEMLDTFIEEEFYEKCTLLAKFQELFSLNQLLD